MDGHGTRHVPPEPVFLTGQGFKPQQFVFPALFRPLFHRLQVAGSMQNRLSSSTGDEDQETLTLSDGLGSHLDSKLNPLP